MSRTQKKPWPTKAAMEQVYEQHLWGGKDQDFYSGFGSHDPEYVDPYVKSVAAFLASFEEPMAVCDLGCGDFNVGKELVGYASRYIAVDIAEPLIERNKNKFSDPGLEFRCLDVSKEELPSGDCAILRHVLQHLSNAEVQCIVSKLSGYNYAIITEHVPEGEFIPNKDIISGQGTRLRKHSGLVLSEPPFNMVAKEQRPLLTLADSHGLMITSLYTFF
ncbi:MAG: methyltransferase domain-containing protein [Bacteroidota bacterium]